jgi:glucose-6-phosphate isomerase/transaldolase/glucose-6-phosphate isomerase
VVDDARTLVPRLLERDAGLWPAGNVSANRLGWIDVPRRMAAEAAELASWAAGIEQSTVVLLGMGGSSLGPAVLEAVLTATGTPGGAGRTRRRLVVCDTTHPVTVSSLDLSDAFVLVSSKSGTTLEPNALLGHAWSQLPDPSRYAAITDPGTPLAALAAERGFRRCFANPPDIGGRYSVLSYFGMVPAALIGYDVAELCARALDADLEEAAGLGMAMGEDARAGRDKVTIVVPPLYSSFGLWVEQLIAESTGKQGTGCVPVPTTEPEVGSDRHVVPLHLSEPADLGEQFYRWEVATSLCGHVLGIDPFDEPNVAESKKNTNDVLAALPLPEVDTASPSEVLAWLSSTVRPGDYVSLQAYLPFGQDAALETVRRKVRDHLGGIATTAGYGPRFLHSTGQLHKGGPDTVVAVQIVDANTMPVVPIPDATYDFGTLIAAQSIGDHRSLLAHGRRVLRVAVDDLGAVG